MPLRTPGDPRRRIALLAVVLGGAIALPGLAFGESTSLFAPAPAPAAPQRVLLAQNQQSAAQLLVRIQELEDQIRTLTGQVEGLQFQLTQMQTMLQKQNEDNEFRFQQLEGGTPGKKTEAATSTDGATPSNALPQDSVSPQDQPSAPRVVEGGADLVAPDADDTTTAGPTPLAVDDDTLGESGDPLLKGGIDRLGTIPEDSSLGGQPLSLDSAGGATISAGDAKAQYEAGYDAITRGDYTFAEEQFSQFLKLFPDDPLAPDATNWLGEALLQRGAYTDAAEVLVDGYTRYKESKRAPDILLKLGVALAGDGQVDYACRTYATLEKTYTSLAPAFRQRLAQEEQKAQCPKP